MRPTFMGFETATRGLMANQKSLDIVGNNLTNLGTTGYTRQRVDLVSMSTNMRFSRYNQNSTSFAGQGVAVYGVSQIRDSFLDKRFREEYADVGYYNVTSSVLEDVSACMDEIAPATMKNAMQGFVNYWDELTKKGDEATGAANLKASATQIVQVFRQMSSQLDNIWNQQVYNLNLDVNNVNSILERVALLNDTIRQEKFNCMELGNSNYQPLELLDQRNVLLDQLSEYGNMTYKEEEDWQVTVTFGGHVAVKGDKFEQLALTTKETDKYYSTANIYWQDSGESLNVHTGALAGSLDMLNGRGLNGSSVNGESFQEGILYYKDKINTLAKTFAESFNSILEIDPASGAPMQYKQLFKFSDDEYSYAANISLSSYWEADTSYLYTDLKGKAETGADDNTYATQVMDMLNGKLKFGEFEGTVFEYINFYSNTKLANNKAYSDSRLEAASTISDDLLTKIQSISGVSMEEEGVDMMMYQKAYDAVSRVFTTLDEMLDKLINGTGVVGR